MKLTRREALVAAAGTGASLVFSRISLAADSACFGWPAIAGEAPVLPYPTMFFESQCWWVQGRTGLAAPDPDFPFTSSHVHLGLALPIGETVTRVNGMWEWPFFAQLHNFQGGHGKLVRGGGFLDNSLQSVSAPANMQNPTTDNETWRGVLRTNSTPSAGKHENRFTFDTTSPLGKRMYQSMAAWMFVDAPGALVPATGRGWYEGPGYTNVTMKSLFRASAPIKAGQSVTYGLAQGATHAFAYADADIHHGSKGTVIFEGRTGSSGSFIIPGDARVLLLGGWERSGSGWNAGVLRLPLA